MSESRQILCLSLSPIYRDARVLRQISVLAEFGDVITVGYGSIPAGASEHVEIPANLPSLPQTVAGVLNLALRRLQASEMSAPAIVFLLEALKGRSFDLVVANEARILAAAFAVADGAPVWADMHEWAPEERTHILSWRLLVAPLMDHLCRSFLHRAAAVTTVGGEIARLYQERYGVHAEVMRNAPQYVELDPSEVQADVVRLVHSGGAVHGRNLEGMIDVVRQLDRRFSLDLYLVEGGDGGRYLRTLEQRAAGDPRITFHAAVRPEELPATLNAYDVGIYWMPPAHTNARFALPNKLFDFVQARLALGIGPTLEMAKIVEAYGLGVVSEGFEIEQCVRSLELLTAESVRSFKQNSANFARELSFDGEREVARRVLQRLIGA